MISFKKLVREIHNVDTLAAKDIYNFYYLWKTMIDYPQAVQTPFGQETVGYYVPRLKEKYIRVFTRLLVNQITKYMHQKRVDPDFPMEYPVEGTSASELLNLIKKTFRSDMQRRNDKWIMVAEYLDSLSKANSTKDIMVYIDRLNAVVHNTNTRVLDKVHNYYGELKKALEHIFTTSNLDSIKQYVDKDIRDLKDQEGITGVSEVIGMDIKPPHQNVDADTEKTMALKSPFNALSYLMQHDNLNLATHEFDKILRGSPFQQHYEKWLFKMHSREVRE